MRRRKPRMDYVQNPETGARFWQWAEIEKPSLDEESRLSLVLDILCGRSTPEEVRKSCCLSSINSVYTWIGKHVSQNCSLSLQESKEEDMSAKSRDDQIKALKAQLRQARQEAALEKLRAKAYDTMISVAEETFNIPIRKKSGTKR